MAKIALDAYLLAYKLPPAGSLIRCEQARPLSGGQRSYPPVFDSPALEEWIGRITASHWPTPRVIAYGSNVYHKEIPGQDNRTMGLAGVVRPRQPVFCGTNEDRQAASVSPARRASGTEPRWGTFGFGPSHASR